ncbi:MAG: catecholate siderophore receptor [Betaproteobacteria bacterium]|jgi:catecholate siderophore receptor|nr:catecholate siderophore receptor [Betaproteobacteria bacterium]
MTQFHRRAIAAAVLAVFSTFAQAQSEQALPEVQVRGEAERADGPVTGYRATRSSTATKTDTPLREVPASVTVVPSALMRDQAMQGMGDVFRYVPGVLMHQGEGNRDQIIIRGTSTTADFYVDSVRDDAQVFRDLYNLERVEVLKGPAGMIFGRGGAGGVVNRVTKKPAFDGVTDLSLTVGSWNQMRDTLDLGRKTGDSGAWRLNAMSETSGSFRKDAHLTRWAVNPTLLVQGESTTLTLGYEHLNDERTADRGIPSRSGRPYSTDPGSFFGNAAQSNAHSYVDSAYAIIEGDLGGRKILKNTFRATYYDRYYQNVYPGSAVDAAGNLTLSAYNNANQRTNFFNQTDLIQKFDAGGMEQTLLLGLELGRQDSTNKRNTGFFGPTGTAIGAVVPATDPFAMATTFRPNGTDADNNVKSTIVGVYAQDQIALSKQWKAIAGLRYDRFKVDFDDRRSLTPPVDLSRADSGWSPRAGLVWTPTAASVYYVSYGYAFLPSGEQLSLATTTADLEPEKAINYEAGARWDLQPKLTLSTAIFRLDRKDVHVTDPANPGFFVKSGKQRVEGIEIGIQGEVTRDWLVYGGYAYLDGRVKEPISSGTAATPASVVPAGNKIGLVPENTFSFWNRFNLGDGWGTGLGLIYQDESYTSFNNSVTLPAFWRVDGGVYYAFSGGKTRLQFNVENIFNKRYYPTVDGDNNISPGAPRNARLTLSLSF